MRYMEDDGGIHVVYEISMLGNFQQWVECGFDVSGRPIHFSNQNFTFDWEWNINSEEESYVFVCNI